ncbi:hypothetical protein ACOMHN_004708 [Nucella lapillus]
MIGEDSGTELSRSLVVGMTGNSGKPQSFRDSVLGAMKTLNHSFGRNPYRTVVGIEIYQGPMFVDTCHFRQFRHVYWADEWEALYGVRPVRPGAALSFHRSNIYPTKPWSYVKNCTFHYCDNVADGNWVFLGNSSLPDWEDKDGKDLVTFLDVDGSVTGQANTQVVRNKPFYTGPHCSVRPSWHVAVCPYKYVQMEFMGSDGVLTRANSKKHPIIIHRDDEQDDTMNLEGTQKNMYLVRVHKSYTVNFNTTLGSVPYSVEVRAKGMESGDILRVGLCLPSDTTSFQIRSDFPPISSSNPPTFVSSLQDLDIDITGRAFFWDITAGMLYFKFLTNGTRQTPEEECASGHLCPYFKIRRLDGGNTTTACADTPPIADTTGLGAPLTNLVTAPPFSVTCPIPPKASIPGRGTPQYRGCYKDKGSLPDLSGSTVELPKAMTRPFCQNRCYYRGSKFAVLSFGKLCVCADWYGIYGVLDNSKCPTSCTGNASTTCGGTNQLEVFTSGLTTVKTPLPVRCGPGNRGAMHGDVCLYLHLHSMDVAQAQALCVRLGGDLTAINNEEKQQAVEVYLREHHPNIKDKVWTGMNQARSPGTWQHRDGAPVASSLHLWKGQHGTDPTKQFAYLSGVGKYMWMSTKDITKANALCDLPPNPPAIERCGASLKGVRLATTGPCYLLVHDTMSQMAASYTCHTSGGVLASPAPLDSEEGQSCYLSLPGVEPKGFSAGASLCESEDWTSHVVSVESQTENTFLSNLAGSSHLLLGLRYTPRYDDFVWRNGGQTTSFSAWKDGHGTSNLVSGRCAVLKADGTWENANCDLLKAKVICETSVRNVTGTS